MSRLSVALVADRLHSAAIHLLRTVRRADDQSPASPARLSALSVLVFGGARSLGDLARAEHVTPPTMSRLVQEMEQEGLVGRRRDRDDRRLVHLRATTRGRRVVERARARRIRLLVEVLGPLSAGELRTLGDAAELIEARVRAARLTSS